MPTDETKAAIIERHKTLSAADNALAKATAPGRWMSDEKAMRIPEVRLREKTSRALPKRLAKLSRLTLEEKGSMQTAEGEVSDRVSQRDIVLNVDAQTARKKFDLTLDQLGPYKIDYSINGTHLVLAGRRGHVACVDWQPAALKGEANLRDRCTDVKFLADATMFAIAQKRFTYMYTNECVEMHVLPSMANVDSLEYLPRHLLLVGASSVFSYLTYLDISTGQEIGSKGPSILKDPSTSMKANPSNGVLCTGDHRGIIKMWSPTVPDALLQMKAHRGSIRQLAFHQSGRFLLSLGVDNKVKIWDTRTLRCLEELSTNYVFNSIDVSAKGIVAIAGGGNVQLFSDIFSTSAQRQRSPFLRHSLGYGCVVEQLRFCPYEDVLGIGHSRGFSSVIVPGSGEANPDFFVANPYETDTHRKERVVSTLLDKLPADTISMDLQIGGVDEERLKEYQANLTANRKAKAIRERKNRSANNATAQAAKPAEDDDELEDMDAKEHGSARKLKNKAELRAEKKKAKWDHKDSSDKVRSKQKMRHSRIVQRTRANRAFEDSKDDQEDPDTAEPETKRRRRENQVSDRANNAALSRLF